MAKGTIDENFTQLEDILSQLETGEVSLEDAFKLYNDGIKIVKNCNNQIDKIEKQIIVLQNGEEQSGD